MKSETRLQTIQRLVRKQFFNHETDPSVKSDSPKEWIEQCRETNTLENAMKFATDSLYDLLAEVTVKRVEKEKEDDRNPGIYYYGEVEKMIRAQIQKVQNTAPFSKDGNCMDTKIAPKVNPSKVPSPADQKQP